MRGKIVIAGAVTGLLGIVLAGFVVVSLLVSAESEGAGTITVLMDFDWIRQGEVGVVRVIGEDIAEVRGVFQDRLYVFYPQGNQYVGLISADMESDVAPYNLQIQVKYIDGTADLVDQPIDVTFGEFGSSEITLTQSKVGLLADDIETAERERLFNIMDRFTPDRYWEGGFLPPSDQPQLDWFGTYRRYNSTYWRQHTGIDVQMAVGTGVRAIANGRVMLVEEMDIRGNYVLIDHGWGIYSGYAHLSDPLVVPGQWVRKEEIVGLSGNTGRSLGAHLHWEMVVGGVWIDPDDFMALSLDAVE
ncbi:MAG: M23 family metallopeptidase [Chloroflexi bacterium]|nr:M23 family metallopeptidase [Chloroflexota bacterium]